MPRFGVTTFPTDYGLSVVDLARAVEERGLDSIFFMNTHIFQSGGELHSQVVVNFPRNTRTHMTPSWRLRRPRPFELEPRRTASSIAPLCSQLYVRNLDLRVRLARIISRVGLLETIRLQPRGRPCRGHVAPLYRLT
jgi:hypothetical protein